MKVIVFTTKKITRGKAKSPKAVQPTSNNNLISLQNHLNSTKRNVKTLLALPSDKYFKHPYFGNLKLFDAITFIEIQTNYHLAIFNDIMK